MKEIEMTAWTERVWRDCRIHHYQSRNEAKQDENNTLWTEETKQCLAKYQTETVKVIQ